MPIYYAEATPDLAVVNLQNKQTEETVTPAKIAALSNISTTVSIQDQLDALAARITALENP